jgi:trans-2,3-dihydro-3-hydroxyanthranilate isomerase
LHIVPLGFLLRLLVSRLARANVRLFVDLLGILECSATGSANGCLAGYLCQYKYFGKDKIDVRVEQGYEIMRPSLLRLKAERQKERINVHIGGHANLVATGKLED